MELFQCFKRHFFKRLPLARRLFSFVSDSCASRLVRRTASFLPDAGLLASIWHIGIPARRFVLQLHSFVFTSFRFFRDSYVARKWANRSGDNRFLILSISAETICFSVIRIPSLSQSPRSFPSSLCRLDRLWLHTSTHSEQRPM